jgi:hypothetical protein
MNTAAGAIQGFTLSTLAQVAPEIALYLMVTNVASTLDSMGDRDTGYSTCAAIRAVGAFAGRQINRLTMNYLATLSPAQQASQVGQPVSANLIPSIFGGSSTLGRPAQLNLALQATGGAPLVGGPSPLAPLDCANSFSAETPIATPDGETPIINLEVGDEVLAYNEQTGEVEAQPVTATIAHYDQTIVELTIDEEVLETTADHPFYTTENEWVEAADLQVGDRVWNVEGGWGVVEAVEVVAEPQMMYNLTVDEAHTFFVGEEGWLVHNDDCVGKTNEHGLIFLDKGVLQDLIMTVIGRMEDIGSPLFHWDPRVNTWWKTGNVPGRGLEGDGPAGTLPTWPENRAWLDRWIAAGHSFAVTTPANEMSEEYVPGVPNGNFTYREVQYIMSKGIEVEDWSNLIE